MDGKTIAVKWATEVHVNAYLSLRQQSQLAAAIDAALAEAELEVAALRAERDDMMELYRLEHERHTATLAQMEAMKNPRFWDPPAIDALIRERDALRAERDRSALVNTENDWMLSRLVSIAEAFQYPQDDVKDFDHVKAVLDVLCERDDMMELYRVEHQRHTSTLAQMEALRADLRACAAALKLVPCSCYRQDDPCAFCDALTRPGVVGLDTGGKALVE